MAWNTVEIKKSFNNPVPQYFNVSANEYQVLQGVNGSAQHVLFGVDGNPITTTGNKLAVRASEIETQLTTIQGYIDGLESAIGTVVDSPTANTLLARIKDINTRLGEVQASPTANTLLARVKNLEDKIAAIIAGTSPAVVTVSGRKVQEITVLNAVAITDTANHDSEIIDVSGISGKKYIFINNSLNQIITVTLIVYGSAGVVGVAVAPQKPTVGIDSTVILTSADIKELAEPLQRVKIRVACSTAPTSGSVYAYLEGVQA